ncbi:hypothetical protein MW887_005195 [Aspergillus wentii]|nr:hypothetical protein MW887_005195 [Aspergillus wentii]
MNIWSGPILLNEESQLEGLQLIDPTSHWQSDITKDSSLSFRCFVNPALIPLYARAGPNLELHTTDGGTSQWLKSKLLGNIWLEGEDLDRCPLFQCPVGLLISVDNTSRAKISGPFTSDLLIYGVLSSATSFERPPTPPVSSSPDYPENASLVTKQELRIYATPISASLIAKALSLPSPPQNPDSFANVVQFAEFLPDLRSPSPKRKRVASLFESAAQHHRRVRQKGGEAVSQLMAPSLSQPSQQLQTLRIKRESEEPSIPALDRIASQRFRSLSLGANLNKPLEIRTDNSRPSTARSHGRGITSKRNTPTPFLDHPTRMEPSPALSSSEGKTDLSSGPKDPDTIILENKNIITRTILTCMRLYGFNRTSTRPGSTNKSTTTVNHDLEDTRIPVTDAAPAVSTNEDEFKAMYHATYRASTFALRKYLKEAPQNGEGERVLPPLLEKGKAMTYIDEFLRLFCEEN